MINKNAFSLFHLVDIGYYQSISHFTFFSASSIKTLPFSYSQLIHGILYNTVIFHENKVIWPFNILVLATVIFYLAWEDVKYLITNVNDHFPLYKIFWPIKKKFRPPILKYKMIGKRTIFLYLCRLMYFVNLLNVFLSL